MVNGDSGHILIYMELKDPEGLSDGYGGVDPYDPES